MFLSLRLGSLFTGDHSSEELGRCQNGQQGDCVHSGGGHVLPLSAAVGCWRTPSGPWEERLTDGSSQVWKVCLVNSK